MNRVRKRRFWDHVDKRMVYDLFVSGEGNIYDVFTEDSEDKLDYFDAHVRCVNYRFDAMDCTGLKDKNGTEIYEGDVLSVPPLENRLESDKTEIGEVFFNHDMYMVHFIPKNHHRWSRVLWNRCKIIGNIYEDSHLLPKEKP